MSGPNPAPRAVTSVWPALLLLAIAIAAFVVARGYSATSGRFPTMVAGAMIVLVVFDVWSRTRLPGAGLVETFGGTSFGQREMMHNPRLIDQVQCIGWIAGAFALMALIGILAASPIFCAAFVRFRGGQSLALSASIGLGVLIFLFVVFEWALDYELYRGLILARGGVSAW
jgi:hypothetical protein